MYKIESDAGGQNLRTFRGCPFRPRQRTCGPQRIFSKLEVPRLPEQKKGAREMTVASFQ